MAPSTESLQRPTLVMVFSYYLGVLLVLWINVQLYFIKSWDILHFVYSMLGVLIIVVTHLPRTKQDYRK